MGQPFAERLISYLKSKGITASSCGVIQSNPDRSKHLETATLAIHGQLIDFVNLRAETYANDSRIPDSIAFGSPLEDALRRDITINSMFWNIHTESVEDFTGKGLDDLHKGVVRTPLAPRETLLDDPLRLLRVIRFATRFQYAIIPELLESMQDSIVHQSLRDKVSRERVGIELDKIFLDRYGLQGLFLINQVGVFSLIFTSRPFAGEGPVEMSRESIHSLLNAFGKFVYFNAGWSQAQLRLALLACGMLPYAGLRYQNKQKHAQPNSPVREDFIVHGIVRDALKFPNRDILALGALLNFIERGEALIFDGERDAVVIGRLLKDLGGEWRLALHLAALRKFWRDGASVEEEFKVREYQTKLSDTLLYIDGIGLSEAFCMKPLLTVKLGVLTFSILYVAVFSFRVRKFKPFWEFQLGNTSAKHSMTCSTGNSKTPTPPNKTQLPSCCLSNKFLFQALPCLCCLAQPMTMVVSSTKVYFGISKFKGAGPLRIRPLMS